MSSGLCSVGLLNDSRCRSRTQRQWLEDVGGSIARGYDAIVMVEVMLKLE